MKIFLDIGHPAHVHYFKNFIMEIKNEGHKVLITARNNVTYVDTFYVREYWGDKNRPDYAIDQADIFVTYINYETTYPIHKVQLENFFIYYYEINN